jgi:hypothetical protein
MLGSATSLRVSSAIRPRTSPWLGSAARICFTSRINIAMVSFWFNLFLSITDSVVAENSVAYIVILQPGEPYWREEACCSKMSAIGRNGQIEADRLPILAGCHLVQRSLSGVQSITLETRSGITLRGNLPGSCVTCSLVHEVTACVRRGRLPLRHPATSRRQ